MTKYAIYSPSKGWYVGFHGKHTFSGSPSLPEIVHDFLSRSGAESMLEVMPSLGEIPDDLEIQPFET